MISQAPTGGWCCARQLRALSPRTAPWDPRPTPKPPVQCPYVLRGVNVHVPGTEACQRYHVPSEYVTCVLPAEANTEPASIPGFANNQSDRHGYGKCRWHDAMSLCQSPLETLCTAMTNVADGRDGRPSAEAGTHKEHARVRRINPRSGASRPQPLSPPPSCFSSLVTLTFSPLRALRNCALKRSLNAAR